MTKEGDFTLNDEDEEEEDEQEEWDGEAAWANDGDDGEGDVKDESAAYLDFLNEEVQLTSASIQWLMAKIKTKAQKFTAAGNDDDDELEEESLLETPLDHVEPYGLFKITLLS